MSKPAAEHRDSAPIRRDPDQVEALRARGRFFYGWYIVACGWLFFLLGYGVLLYAPLILFDSWSEDFGWSRGILFGSYSFALLTVAVVSPFAGKLTDSHGARPVMFVGAIVLGAGTLGLRWMSEPWHLYLAFVISGVGKTHIAAIHKAHADALEDLSTRFQLKINEYDRRIKGGD